MKRFAVVALVVLVSSVSSMFGALAQEAPAVTIPVNSLGSTIELSPDDELLAWYNSYVINMDAPLPELLPITLLNINTGETLGSLSGYSDWVTDIAFNSDGSRLATMHRNGDILLWDVASKSVLTTFETYGLGGGWVQFLPDDHTLLYRAGEFVIAMLDTDSGAITRLFGRHIDTYYEFSEKYTAYPGRGDMTLLTAQVSPDGRYLFVSTGNDEILRWDLDSGDMTTLREPSEEPARFAIRRFVFAPDSSTITYFDDNDDLIHTMDVETGDEISTHAGAFAFALSPDGSKLAWLDREAGAVMLVDTSSSDEPTTLFTMPEGIRVMPILSSLLFTSDGSKLVVGGLLPYSEEDDDKNAIFVFDLSD